MKIGLKKIDFYEDSEAFSNWHNAMKSALPTLVNTMLQVIGCTEALKLGKLQMAGFKNLYIGGLWAQGYPQGTGSWRKIRMYVFSSSSFVYRQNQVKINICVAVREANGDGKESEQGQPEAGC